MLVYSLIQRMMTIRRICIGCRRYNPLLFLSVPWANGIIHSVALFELWRGLFFTCSRVVIRAWKLLIWQNLELSEFNRISIDANGMPLNWSASQLIYMKNMKLWQIDEKKKRRGDLGKFQHAFNGFSPNMNINWIYFMSLCSFSLNTSNSCTMSAIIQWLRKGFRMLLRYIKWMKYNASIWA